MRNIKKIIPKVAFGLDFILKVPGCHIQNQAVSSRIVKLLVHPLALLADDPLLVHLIQASKN